MVFSKLYCRFRHKFQQRGYFASGLNRKQQWIPKGDGDPVNQKERRKNELDSWFDKFELWPNKQSAKQYLSGLLRYSVTPEPNDSNALSKSQRVSDVTVAQLLSENKRNPIKSLENTRDSISISKCTRKTLEASTEEVQNENSRLEMNEANSLNRGTIPEGMPSSLNIYPNVSKNTRESCSIKNDRMTIVGNSTTQSRIDLIFNSKFYKLIGADLSTDVDSSLNENETEAKSSSADRFLSQLLIEIRPKSSCYESNFIRPQQIEEIGYHIIGEDRSRSNEYFLSHPGKPSLNVHLGHMSEDDIVNALSNRPRYVGASAPSIADWSQTPVCFDDFFVQKKLGYGSYGVVLKVNPLRGAIPNGPFPKTMALKIISLSHLSKVEYNAIFNEIKIHDTIPNHDRLLTILISFRQEKYQYFGMPYMPGGSLYDIIRLGNGKLNPNATLEVLEMVLCATAHLHKHGWAHLDIKPENIVLSSKYDHLNNPEQMPDLKLIDYSFAVQFEKDGTGYYSNQLCGTTGYMSPQICQGKMHAPEKSDLFSIGCLLYEMITGKRPTDGIKKVNELTMMMQNAYLFHFEEWKKCHPRLSDLCTAFLSYDEMKRPNASEALEWVRYIRSSSSALNESTCTSDS